MLSTSGRLRWLVLALALIVSAATLLDGFGGNAAFAGARPARPVVLSADGEHVCEALADGYIDCSGRDGFGEGVSGSLDRFRRVDGIPPALSVATASDHSCALTRSHTVLCWGLGAFGELGKSKSGFWTAPSMVSGLGRISQLATASYDTCALGSSGTVWCWGLDNYFQAGSVVGGIVRRPHRIPGVPAARQISLAADHGCAISRAEEVWCWGSDWFGQSGGAPRRKPVGATPIALPGRASAIAVTYATSCALILDAGVYCWGSRFMEDSEVGAPTYRGPSLVPGSGDASQVWLSNNLGCYLTSQRQLWCWGNDGGSGFLGANTSGTTPPLLVPIRVLTEPGIEQLVANYARVCLLRTQGRVRCWGSPTYSRLPG
jgi:alpha-tubulin suppressor-like RCC1 family protein